MLVAIVTIKDCCLVLLTVITLYHHPYVSRRT